MTRISGKLRRAIIDRARHRCEYCLLHQEGQEASFHIDHVRPAVDGGLTTPENLALACVSCSLRKGARQTAVDPVSQEVVPLFSPRDSLWDQHFRWEDLTIVGITPTGRATVTTLSLNRALILAIRAEERLRGRDPSIPH